MAAQPVDDDGIPPDYFRNEILLHIFRLCREIRTNAYVGYSFFVLLALLKNIRPHAWEGANRIDFVRE